MAGFLSKLLTFGEGKQLKNYQALADKIGGLEPERQAKSDEQLRAFTDELRGRVRAGASTADVLPEAVGTTWSGLSYQEKTASGSSGAVYLLAIVFVFLTLSALYNSWGLPLAILLSVPLAVLGALLFVGAAYLVSPEFINNIYMQISLVMLIGLSAKNAILVVEYADQLFFEKNMDLKAATIEAARLRMRPIMMTAFSFILGVMPLIFASGVYATARNIMGMALVGGMLLATMLGIFIYPALYYLVARVGKFERKRELKQKES